MLSTSARNQIIIIYIYGMYYAEKKHVYNTVFTGIPTFVLHNTSSFDAIQHRLPGMRNLFDGPLT